MKKKILINARYPEEKRVAIIDGETLIDFYVEVAAREHLKGNIYKGVVTRVEPGLQACFVNFGPKKHGFLQMREIIPQFHGKKVDAKRPRIQDAIQKGQELIVQVEKEERDTKGASLTTYLSLPGRYIVMMPGEERVGISRKIEDREDRDRLKEIFASLKLPKKMGFILRTAGGDSTKEELENDLKYLTKLWSKIQRDTKKEKAPALIYKEQDLAVRTVRDYLTTDVQEVIVDDEEAYKMIKDYLKKTAPWRKINIKLTKDRRPIFGKHHIEEQIAKIHDRYVHLPSRGYLVIDRTEALTAIDVNSGRSKKEENVEATALKTNLEAADEIARQLRLRDIGGLIVCDFIDMASSKNRRELEKRMKDALGTDKAHWEITGISKFGMIEMTRERMRPAYMDAMYRKCEGCNGTGTIRTDEMIAISVLREIHRKSSQGDIGAISCRMPVESLNYLVNVWREDLVQTEKDSGVKITLTADPALPLGQYKIDLDKRETGEEAAPRKEAPKTEAPPKEEVPGEAVGAEPKEGQEAAPRKPHRKRRRRSRKPRRDAGETAGAEGAAEAAPAAAAE